MNVLTQPVFDVHIHVQPWDMLKPDVRLMMEKSAPEEVREALSSAESLLRYLDREGVERACCINYVAPDVMGFTPSTNDWIADFTSGARDRLIPVGSVHPEATPEVADETRRILDLGIGMIKIHPPHQRFAANSYLDDQPALADLYGICERESIPVMVHTGTSIFPGARNRFADPIAVDDVAVDFPNLRIILAHAGRPLYMDTAFFLARRHPNVHLDLSGMPPARLLEYLPRLEEISHKAVWGTDWPSPGVRSIRQNVEEFRELPISEEATRRILYTNAAEIFSS